MLRPMPAFVAQTVYLFIGAVGLPVFSGFQGGAQYLMGPTGGFLLAYPLSALIISLFISRWKGRPLFSVFGYALAMAVCYCFGAGWYTIMSGSDLWAAVTVTVVPFIIPDIIKCIFAHLISSVTVSRLRLR